MLAVALDQARIGLAEGGIPVGGALFRIAPCWFCTGLIYQFVFKQVIVGDSVNVQGGLAFLREKGFDIVDLSSAECIEMLGDFQRNQPALWNKCIGQG